MAGPNTSCSYGGAWDMTDPTSPPDLWLAGRLLWNKGDGGSWSPVIFVNEVRHPKGHVHPQRLTTMLSTHTRVKCTKIIT
jgi:hypothetical protein